MHDVARLSKRARRLARQISRIKERMARLSEEYRQLRDELLRIYDEAPEAAQAALEEGISIRRVRTGYDPRLLDLLQERGILEEVCVHVPVPERLQHAARAGIITPEELAQYEITGYRIEKRD